MTSTRTAPLDDQLGVPLTRLEVLLLSRLAQLQDIDGEEFLRELLADGVHHDLFADLRRELAHRLHSEGDSGK